MNENASKSVLRRNTIQRSVILEEVRKAHGHPTAQAVYQAVRRRIPYISFGTVYRNLNILRDEGLILELSCGKQSCRYSGIVEQHYHLFCLKCMSIFDIETPVLTELDSDVSKRTGFQISYHRIDFYGYCKACRRQERENRD